LYLDFSCRLPDNFSLLIVLPNHSSPVALRKLSLSVVLVDVISYRIFLPNSDFSHIRNPCQTSLRTSRALPLFSKPFRLISFPFDPPPNLKVKKTFRSASQHLNFIFPTVFLKRLFPLMRMCREFPRTCCF